MANIVSTKFGDRRLVHLPPVNMSGTKTANVDTILPRDTSANDPNFKLRVADAKAQFVHKQYAYRNNDTTRKFETKNAWVGAPRPRQLPEGNLVTDAPRTADGIFHQLYQEAKTNTMQNYDQGQYPVIPPVSGQQHMMQYTNHGLNTMAPQQQPAPTQQMAPQQNFQQQAPMQMPTMPSMQFPQMPALQFPGFNNTMPQQQQQQPQQQMPQQQMPPQQQMNMPQQPQSNQNSNANEKHIYYGPNGEVLPSPPPGFNANGAINCEQCPEDFAIEGVLHHGRLQHLTLIEAARGFPKIPDFLVRDLLEKYGHNERTLVRIVVRGGQAYVHATPEMALSPRMEADYVPVYLDDGEEFDYGRFYDDYQSARYPRYRNYAYEQDDIPPQIYRPPPSVPRLPPLDDRRLPFRRLTPDLRPDTIDSRYEYRWNTDNVRRVVNTAPTYPVERRTKSNTKRR